MRRKQVIACTPSNSRVSDKSRAITSLISKMKITIDKANQICTSTSVFDSNECGVAWEELDDLIENYMLVLKDIQSKEKVKISEQHHVINNNDWDVIH